MVFLSPMADARTADEVSPLLVGSEVPSVVLKSAEGEPVDLAEELSGESTVVIFYRGGWCPYCNVHLSELASIEGELKELGYQIVAISPDTPKALGKSREKQELGYRLLSDSEYEGMKAFGIGFEHKRRGMLPVPSVFLVNPEGQITFQYVNPNYRFRLPAKLLIAAAESLKAE